MHINKTIFISVFYFSNNIDHPFKLLLTPCHPNKIQLQIFKTKLDKKKLKTQICIAYEIIIKCYLFTINLVP